MPCQTDNADEDVSHTPRVLAGVATISYARRNGKVMCLDFHPVHNSLLAVGCHDGTVMVFDVRHKANRPIYSSSIKTGKHTDPVWQVRARMFWTRLL